KIEVELQTLASLMSIYKHQSIDLLKMDIEGAEYEVIPEILTSDIKVSQILVEFHHRMVEGGRQKTKKIVRLLRQHGYQPFAWSNRLEEVSFIRA
ncbi:MAG: FkbM family methyltransferase, partial [Bacteroidota bacterium]